MSTSQNETPLRRLPQSEPSVTGLLADLPAYTLLNWAERNRFTGKLILDVGERLDELYFLNGVVQGTSPIELSQQLFNVIGLFEGRYTLHRTAVHPPGVGLPPSKCFTSIEELLLHATPDPSVRERSDSIPNRGSFSTFTAWDVMNALTRRKFSGRLLLESENQKTLLHYRNGRIASVSSSSASETLAIVLKRWSFLPASQIDEHETKARDDNMRFRDLIRTEGLLSESSLRDALTTLHFERILRILSWRVGTFLVREDLSGALLRLVEQDRAKSLLLAVPDNPQDLLAWAQELVSGWGERRHPSILVTVGLGTEHAFDPAKPDLSDTWKEHVLPVIDPIAAWLPLIGEAPAWKTADGTANVRRLMSRLHAQYDRILWLAQPPSNGSPLLSVGNHVVLVVQGGKTGTHDVSKVMADFQGQSWAGFIFREVSPSEKSTYLNWDQIGSMASPIVRSMTKFRDFLVVQGRRIPRLARKRREGSSTTRE